MLKWVKVKIVWKLMFQLAGDPKLTCLCLLLPSSKVTPNNVFFKLFLCKLSFHSLLLKILGMTAHILNKKEHGIDTQCNSSHNRSDLVQNQYMLDQIQMSLLPNEPEGSSYNTFTSNMVPQNRFQEQHSENVVQMKTSCVVLLMDEGCRQNKEQMKCLGEHK